MTDVMQERSTEVRPGRDSHRGSDRDSELDLEKALKAIASPRRLQILEWLKDPARHFPPQEHGDPIEHGACNQFITEKLGVSQPAASRHMKVLADAGLVTPTSRHGWVYYRRDEHVLDRLKRELEGI